MIAPKVETRSAPEAAAPVHGVLPVVLCGGSGTRLWPLSRERYPKQLLPLLGSDSLLQATLRRIGDCVVGPGGVLPSLVVCNEEHRFLIAQQLRDAGWSPHAILLEPSGRNTAPALTLAALAAVREGGSEPVLLVMPADHVVADTAAFHDAIRKGARLAAGDRIVTFGIVPTAPETGYGYIRRGAPIGDGADGARIAAFIEKPAIEAARSYVKSPDYLWNSGIFMLRPSVWLDAIGRHRPDILAACTEAAKFERDGQFLRVDKPAFTRCPADSIDYAVMEKSAQQAAVVPLDAGWSDVGAWDAIWQACPRDAQGNVLRGDVIAADTHGSLLFAGARMVACVGLENVVVIETADAVMVADKGRTQEVRQIVDELKKRGRSEHVAHRKVHRPWGHYDSIDQGERFQVKRIVVNPGASLSLQMHHHRAEHWIVVRGTAEVTRGEETFLLSENESTYIPIGITHRLANPGKLPLELIEVQSGAYLGEDDIVRFEDQYGRKDS